MIGLGQRVKDIISGFEGVATARLEYITGCVQYCVSPAKLDKEGKMQAGEYIDECRLQVVSGKAVKVKPGEAKGFDTKTKAPTKYKG